jgi:phosphate transport system substrate-binding protein
MKKTFFSAVLAAFLGLLPKLSHAQLIQIDGSSTVFPVSEAVAEEFQKSKKGKVKVTVGIAGTGGGFKKFCRGETDISNASRPILKAEIETCKQSGVQFIELPVAYDALTVIVNPKNGWVKSLTVPDLKKMWEPAAQGKVTSWNQLRSEWPNNPLKLFGPGADSGTFDYFTEAIVGKAKSSRGDFTASEDDNVLVQGVANDRNALGYFGFAYYTENQNKLKAAAIDSGKGPPVLPSAKSVEDGTYQPLSRPIFIYVSKKSYDSKPEVKEFVEYFLKQGPQLIRQVKYVPLPQTAYTVGMEHLKKGKVGTVFGGEAEVGVKIDDLLKREAKF